MDNERTLGFRGDVNLKYTDAALGDERVTVMVRISGSLQSYIEVTIMIFKNRNCSYPI